MPVSAIPPIPWSYSRQGGFITAFCTDPYGDIWVATEDWGVWAWNGKRWTHFTADDTNGGLGDNDIYSLTCDHLGRIWAGTDRHGVSVYDGYTWHDYNQLTGPLGCHVIALATSPLDGDVWGATEAGLFRYSLHDKTWTHYTRVSGLPSDQTDCLAFAKDGTLFVGTLCNGIAIGSAKDDYHTWHTVTGPSKIPDAAGGAGLPTNQINCLLVAHDGVVYAGTTTGLAHSTDNGKTWRFLRGADWKAKLENLQHPIKPVHVNTDGLILSGDYITALAQDHAGYLYVGHRQTGLQRYDALANTWSPVPGEYVGYVTSLLATEGSRLLIGTYGDGLKQYSRIVPLSITMVHQPQTLLLPFPQPAAPPTLAQLNRMLRIVEAVRPDPNEYHPSVVPLNDDWKTEGNWLGRYGRYWACLCAICSPSDYIWGAGWEPVSYDSQIGPVHDPGDSLRYWVQWLYSNDPRVLEMPPTYLSSRIKLHLTQGHRPRREAEQDDHGEGYPSVQGGHGIYETVTIPHGLFYLSLYEMNKDGHDDSGNVSDLYEVGNELQNGPNGPNRFRDYTLSIRPNYGARFSDSSDFSKEPQWAKGRVVNFWTGVWKRFLVRGPVTLTVKVGRNYSFNTILQAVMLDHVDEFPSPYYGTPMQRLLTHNAKWHALLLARVQKKSLSHDASDISMNAVANLLYAHINGLRFTDSVWWAVNDREIYLALLRYYLHLDLGNLGMRNVKKLNLKIARCDYEIGLYPDWEKNLKSSGLKTAREIEKSLKWNGLNGEFHGFEAINSSLTNREISIAKS